MSVFYLVDGFVKIPASKLTLEDEFLKYEPASGGELLGYEPRTYAEVNLKTEIEKGIKKGLFKDFLRPQFDPSFLDEACEELQFVQDKEPAVGKSYTWWSRKAKSYAPNRGSRLGSKNEYVAFLGCLIKSLVEDEGVPIREAWDAVCGNSKALGNYLNSDFAIGEMELTGARPVCEFLCDLGNTMKLLAEDSRMGSFWIAGGHFANWGYENPVAKMVPYEFFNSPRTKGVGWIILER